MAKPAIAGADPLSRALACFLSNGGRVDRQLTIMGSSGDELTTLGRIYCNATREPGEDDESLRIRCLTGWRDDAGL